MEQVGRRGNKRDDRKCPSIQTGVVNKRGGGMTINKSRGNMYLDKDTWNGMYGICSYGCSYCFNRRWWKIWGKMRLNERALEDNLGSGRNLFVGSSCDMFAENIPNEWIRKVLVHCNMFDNTYLFQTKNPKRFIEYIDLYPRKTILGTTIETNRDNEFSKAPLSLERYCALASMLGFNKMISIEPIMDFDLNTMIQWITEINPEYVSIGANTNLKVKLPEPSWDKVEKLITELKKFTEVKIKDNLYRLKNESS